MWRKRHLNELRDLPRLHTLPLVILNMNQMSFLSLPACLLSLLPFLISFLPPFFPSSLSPFLLSSLPAFFLSIILYVYLSSYQIWLSKWYPRFCSKTTNTANGKGCVYPFFTELGKFLGTDTCSNWWLEDYSQIWEHSISPWSSHRHYSFEMAQGLHRCF